MKKSLNAKSIILYADDDIDDLQLVQDAFAQYNDHVEVVTATDGVKALSYIESISAYDPAPCLIILDINMPRMNGKEVLMNIREMDRFKDIPVILFTTSSQPQDKAFAAQNKAGFITKPLDIRQMEIITDQFINHCTDEVKRHLKRKISDL